MWKSGALDSRLRGNDDSITVGPAKAGPKGFLISVRGMTNQDASNPCVRA